MVDLKAAKGSDAEDSSGIPRPKSRDSTKNLGQAIKQILLGATPKYYGLFNAGVNTAATGMPTKQYGEVHVNLRPKEAAREAFTDSMLGMTGTINAFVRDDFLQMAAAQTNSWSSCKTSMLKQQNCWIYTRRPSRCSLGIT